MPKAKDRKIKDEFQGTNEREPLEGENEKVSEDMTGNDGEKACCSVKEEATNCGPSEIELALEEKKKEIEEYKAYAMRMQADFENHKKRVRQEIEDTSQRVAADILLAIIPVYDNLGRALQTLEKGEEGRVRTGVEMIYRQFTSVLENLGVEAIKSVNSVFDPNLHEAVMTEENPELPDNTVMEEFQKGYLLHGRLLRPAMVKVVKNNE